MLQLRGSERNSGDKIVDYNDVGGVFTAHMVRLVLGDASLPDDLDQAAYAYAVGEHQSRLTSWTICLYIPLHSDANLA